MFGSFPPSPLVVCASKVYSGLGADIVMKSLHSQGQRADLGVAFRSESGNSSSSHVLGSRNSLALSYGVYRISVDWPRTPKFRQPLNYRSMPRSIDGIPSGHHVYTARKTAPKASFCCSFHRSIRAALARFCSKATPERRLMGEKSPHTPVGRVLRDPSCGLDCKFSRDRLVRRICAFGSGGAYSVAGEKYFINLAS